MNIQSFFKFVEIRTKVASVIPFIYGFLFAYYRYKKFTPWLTFIFLICLLSIDMATTAINNFMDYKKAIKKHGYNYMEHNAMVKNSISDKNALVVISTLIFVATILGLFIFIKTDILILIIGTVSFFVGIFYTTGPIPISRSPLGEVFSGLFMGGIIFFTTVYIQIYKSGIFKVFFTDNMLNISINYTEFLIIGLCSLPMIFMIANIMLANNICDIDDDIQNNRFTLPYYLGKKLSLNIFQALYYLSYLVIILSVFYDFMPPLTLITLITLFPVIINLRKFVKLQSKKETFIYTIKNFIIISSVLIVSFVITIIGIKYIGL